MWCKQHPTRPFLQYLRHITSNPPSSHAPPDGLYSASRPAILSVPVSRKLLGGRANKQDKQNSHRTPPPRHRRRQRVPPPVWQWRILDVILRHRGTPLHRLPRRHTGRTLRDSVLLGTRKNRSSRNTPTDDTTRAGKTTVVAKFSQKESHLVALTLLHQMCGVSFLASA